MRPSEASTKTPFHDSLHIALSQGYIKNRIMDNCVVNNKELISWDKKIDSLRDEWRELYKETDEFTDKITGTVKRNYIGISCNFENLQREVPLFSGYQNKYLSGVCDAILTYKLEIYNRIDTHNIVLSDEDGDGFPIEHGLKAFHKPLKSSDTETIPCCEHCLPMIFPKLKEFRDKDNYSILGSDETVRRINHYHKSYGVIIDLKPILNSISGLIGQLKSYREIIGKPDYSLMVITNDYTNKDYDEMLKEEGILILRTPPNNAREFMRYKTNYNNYIKKYG